MDIDFSTTGSVKVSMVKYLKEAIVDFPEEIETGVVIPAQEHLFDARPEEDRILLNPAQKGYFPYNSG